MEISKVTKEDCVSCASLMDIVAFATKLADALKIAGISLAGPGLDRREEAKKWLHVMGVALAKEVKAGQAPAVVSVGEPQKLSGPNKKKSKKK